MGRDSAAAPPVVHLHARRYFSLLARRPARRAALGREALALTEA